MIPAEDMVILDFIGHTDFAAALRPSYHCPGAVKLESYFAHFRRMNPQGTIVLDAGDILCGAPIINLTHGEPVVDVVNLFGYDAMTLGNHEFDYGREVMQSTLSRAAFPLLSANLEEKDTGEMPDFVKPYIMLERAGLKIGVLGVTTEYTPYMVKKESFTHFRMRSVVETCRQYIPILRSEGADIVVVLGHLPGRLEKDGDYAGELFDLARQVDGIDILFGGHNKGDIACTLNNTIISKTGFSAQSIGHIRVTFDRASRKITCLTNEIVPVLHGTHPVSPNPVVEQAVEAALAPFTAALDEVLGEAEDDLVVNHNAENSLGNFFTDCIREACNALIGLMNSTSCFGYIPKGVITAEMIMWVMCFNDNLYKGWMTGRQIREMFELTYVKKHQLLNGTLQFSGLQVVIDTGKPEHQRVISIALEDGTLLRDAEKYLVGTSAYIASGGNEYSAVTALTDWHKTSLMTHAVFIEKMRAIKKLDSKIQGRIIDLSQG